MLRITESESLLPHNTFGMDVRAAHFAEYDTAEDLVQALPEFRTAPWWHIGRGSNLLFTGDYPGWVLHSRIVGIETLADDGTDVLLRVGAGEVWDDVVDWAVGHGLYGAENLSLIPGEVGAAAVQNIGAYGVEAADLIRGVETVDVTNGTARLFRPEECRYGYRASIFKTEEVKRRYIVTHVRLALTRRPMLRLDYKGLREALPSDAAPTLSEVRDAIVRIRRAKLPDPAELGNAGSFFKNPVVSPTQFAALRAAHPDVPHYPAPDGLVKVPAGWLIEQCGWRGRRIGAAGVYDRQCLVLVNHGGATPRMVLDLCQAIVRSVRERFGIDIHPEVNIL